MSSLHVKTDKETLAKLDEFYKSVSDTAEDVVFRIFPAKILELHQFIESTSTTTSPFNLLHSSTFTDTTVYPRPSGSEEPEIKKRKRVVDGSGVPNGAGIVKDIENARYPNLVLANKHMAKIHEDVKRECEQLADNCDKVKLWVNLNMPKIEDGDNFGVQIQEEVLQELHRSQESAYNLRDFARQDHLNRAKICSKLIKYPHIEDYTLGLRDHDDKHLFMARQHLIDIRNVYAVLYDIISKNIAKLRKPKANNSVGLY
ncbi:hypothetical protein JAAARDRAFT_374986 [Jaapia argillacea MUCL 33604]|uniref:Proteasome activator PA28 C-terminal domain-containing protein n=1 Tax=Jaapia argillacea MUCL 33604 TaxID=933084 RepID=A0A067QB10_9AGAM|nr:hypothetical protein JAAARDRAFT_374986 [Jaapia argillacea MUCL 33604]